MTQEEKLQLAKDWYNDPSVTKEEKSHLEELFPKLKESEDENIKQDIIDYLKGFIPHHDDYLVTKSRKWISWLEKQGEQKSQGKSALEVWKDMRLEVYQQASGNRHEPNCSDDSTKMFSLTDIDEIFEQVTEKQGEQKPNDKVEPKFKVGDFIKHNTANIIRKVVSINNDGSYDVENIKSNIRIKLFTPEQNFHLWSIKDAKDGDVLVSEWGNPFIFNGVVTNRYVGAYGGINSCKEFELCNTTEDWTSLNVSPATKEQCELLFRKMKEAGYEWYTEKKELRKIEEKSVLSEKYIAEVFERTGLAKIVREQANDKLTCALQDTLLELSKSTPTTDDWIEDYWQHSKVNNPDSYDGGEEIQFDHDGFVRFCNTYCNEPDWSEEDNKMLNNVIHRIEVLDHYWNRNEPSDEKMIDWLKSFKDKYSWKPTDEQIMALRWTLNNIPYCKQKEEISGLLDQIKNL